MQTMKQSLTKQPSDDTWLVPSFVDRHCHPLFAAREMAALDISHCRNLSELLEVLTQHLQANPELKWLDATAFDYAASQDFLATTLDTVSSKIPITLHSNDHHALWVNSAALRVAGLFEQVPDLSHGEIVVDASGAPSGLLLEWSAMKLVLDKQPTPSLEEDLAHLKRAQDKLRAAGISACSDAWIDPGMGEVYLEAARRKLLTMPVELWVRVSPENSHEQLSYLRELIALQQASEHSNLVKIAGIKIFLDGVLSAKSAWVLDRYQDGSFGSQIWHDSELLQLLRSLAEISPKLMPHFHAIGDAAVRQALDTIAVARAINLWSTECRPVVAHAELVATADCSRFEELDVEVVISPQWLAKDAQEDNLREILQANVIERVGDFAQLVEANAHLTYGSDWPVSDPEPLRAIEVGVNHLMQRGYSPAQATKIMWRVCGPK